MTKIPSKLRHSQQHQNIENNRKWCAMGSANTIRRRSIYKDTYSHSRHWRSGWRLTNLSLKHFYLMSRRNLDLPISCDMCLYVCMYTKTVLLKTNVNNDFSIIKLLAVHALRWRHNGHDGSQITSLTTVYSIVHSSKDQRKHQRSASLAFVREFTRWPVNSPHKWPVTRKIFPFVDVNMTYEHIFVTPSNARGVWCWNWMRNLLLS